MIDPQSIYRLLVFAVLLFWSGCGHAQTHAIACKSRGGTPSELRALLAEAEADFGVAPDPLVREARLDSVIFVSDTLAVMVTSEWCSRSRSQSVARRWQAGRDTVIRHPLFSRQHELRKIRQELVRHYFFRNPVDSVRFVGYDNRDECTDVSPMALPPVSGKGPQPPFGPGLLVGAAAFLSALLVFLISWLYRRLPAVS